MIEQKEITIKTQKGDERTYLLSKFPAIAGREIVSKYPLSNIPKVGEYEQSEEVMLKLMAFVSAAPAGAAPIPLVTRALVDNHVPDWETLAKLEWSQLEYNTSFFGEGLNSDFFANFSQKAAQWISKTLTPLLVTSLQAGKPPSKN